MTFVLDASVALSWLFVDEQTPETLSLLQRTATAGAVVPALWRLEVANALQLSLRRQRITAANRDKAIHQLTRLPIEVDSETDARAWNATLHLADLHRVTVYDACYLELALRRSLALATRDAALAVAAGNAGLTLLPTQ